MTFSTLSNPDKNANQRYRVTEWKDRVKGESLRAYLTLVQVDTGVALYECQYHERHDGTRWVGLPARDYLKPGESKKSYFRLVDFPDKSLFRRFQTAALQAVDDYLGAKG